jgi:hypothetical protein
MPRAHRDARRTICAPSRPLGYFSRDFSTSQSLVNVAAQQRFHWSSRYCLLTQRLDNHIRWLSIKNAHSYKGIEVIHQNFFCCDAVPRIVAALGARHTSDTSSATAPHSVVGHQPSELIVNQSQAKERTMKHKFAMLAIATAVAVSGGAVYAQQVQQFGRDSVNAVPGKSSSNVTTRSDVQRFGRDSVYATPSTTSSDPVLTGSLNRYGRDSVYATQLPAPSAPVSANAAGLQRFGRDSVYAEPFQNGSAQQTSTAIGTTGTKGNGG